MTAPPASLQRRRRLWLLGAATAASLAATAPASGRMKEQGAGVIAFEFMLTQGRAETVLRTWGPAGRSAARESLERDFLLIASYGPASSALCRYLSDRARQLGLDREAALGQLAARAGMAAAGLDVIENLALFGVLRGHTSQPYPAIAGAAAGAKFFCLLGLVLPYVAIVGFKSRRRQVHAGAR